MDEKKYQLIAGTNEINFSDIKKFFVTGWEGANVLLQRKDFQLLAISASDGGFSFLFVQLEKQS